MASFWKEPMYETLVEQENEGTIFACEDYIMGSFQ